MRMRLFALLLLAVLSCGTAADERGWFLEQPVTAATELGADLLAPRYNVPDHLLLALNAGYRFNASFSLQAKFRGLVTDRSRGFPCADSDYACSALEYRPLDDTTGYALSLMPSILLHDDLAIYGRLGIQGWNVEANGNPDLKKRDLLFGIGLGYDVSNPLRLQLEYRSLDLDIKLTSVGFSWRF